MKLIEDYENMKDALITVMRKAVDTGERSNEEPVEMLILLDIAHSLSIIAEATSKGIMVEFKE